MGIIVFVIGLIVFVDGCSDTGWDAGGGIAVGVVMMLTGGLLLS